MKITKGALSSDVENKSKEQYQEDNSTHTHTHTQLREHPGKQRR